MTNRGHAAESAISIDLSETRISRMRNENPPNSIRSSRVRQRIHSALEEFLRPFVEEAVWPPVDEFALHVNPK